jgi:4-hydroxy-4-methyl-2-oxoglutarate aldolase
LKHRIVRNVPSLDPAIAAGLRAVGVATAHEAQGRSGLMDAVLRPVVPEAEVAGRAITVLVPAGDNWMIQAAVELCVPGDVLVVATISPCTDGMIGEMLAVSLRARGVVGVVIDAGCRDVRALRRMGFPIWSRAISAQGTVKASPGSINVPVVCAGVRVHPGDAVIADDDGVVVVPRAEAAAVLAASQARVAREDMLREKFARGEPSPSFEASRERLAATGIVWIDREEGDD